MARGNAAAIVLAAGAGLRMASAERKAFLSLGGRPILAWSITLFQTVQEVAEIAVAVAPQDRARAEALVQQAGWPNVQVVEGGATRHESELRSLEALAGQIESGAIDLVLVHDAARPFATPALVGELIREARQHGAAIPGQPAPGNLALRSPDQSLSPAPGELWLAQTPQAFAARFLLEAHRRAQRDSFNGSDTASVVERLGQRVVVIEGSYDNIKITTPADLVRAEQIARYRATDPTGKPLLAQATSVA